MLSQDYFKECKETYSFIYVDGDHRPESVLADANASFKVLEPNGILWFDDYGANPGIRGAIDSFYETNKDSLKCIYKDYQIGFLKLETTA